MYFVLRIMYKKFITVASFLLILNTLYLILYTSQAHAQTVSVGLYPPIMKINLNPPASITQPIVIKNFTDDPESFSVKFQPFVNSPRDNGEVTYLSPQDPIPGNDPKIFEKMQLLDGDHVANVISLKPQEAKTLILHIGIPQDEPASDYYFSILFINQGIGNDQSNVSAVSGGIGTNILLSVGPQTQTTGIIKQFSTLSFVQHGPLPFTVSIQNNSTHFINPTGTIVIQNMFGQYVGKVNLLSVNILEHSSRFVPDDKNINDTHATWPEKFLLGVYKAKLTVALSDTGPLFTRTIYFFALPTEAIIAIIALILLGTIIFVRVRQRLKKL